MLVVAALLEGQIPEEDRDLLQDDAVRFKVSILVPRLSNRSDS